MTKLKTNKVNFLVFRQFHSKFAKFYKNLQFTEFHSLLKENFEEKSYVLPLYLIQN